MDWCEFSVPKTALSGLRIFGGPRERCLRRGCLSSVRTLFSRPESAGPGDLALFTPTMGGRLTARHLAFIRRCVGR